MGLTDDPEKLWLISDGWCAERDSMLEAIDEIESQALTRYYGRARGDHAREPRNRAFGYIALMLPHMVQRAPQWEAVSDGTMLGEVVAEATAAGLTQLHSLNRIHQVLRPCAFDYNLCWTAAFVDTAPTGRRLTSAQRRSLRAPLGTSGLVGHTPTKLEDPHGPRVTPLDRRRVFWDVQARTWPEVRAYGHDSTLDVDWLQEQAEIDSTWNKEIVNGLVFTSDWKDLGYAGDASLHGHEIETRRQVVVRTIYVPEAEPYQGSLSRGQRGMIYTLIRFGNQTGGSGARFLREPIPWTGHPSGPYVIGGQYQPSKSTFPMSRLLAGKDSTDMVNAIARVNAKRTLLQRRVMGVDASQASTARRIQSAPDGAVVNLRGEANRAPTMVQFDFGGIQQQDIAMMQVAIADNDETLGRSAASRGQTGGSNSATEVAVANASIETDIDYTLAGWDEWIGEIGERSAYTMLHNRKFLIHMGAEGKERIRSVQARQLVSEGTITADEANVMLARMRGETFQWQGGDAIDAEDFDPEQIRVRTKAYSMGGSAEQEARAEDFQFGQAFFALCQQQAATPWVDMTFRFTELGKRWGRPGLERFVDQARKQEMLQISTMENPVGEVASLAGSSAAPRGGVNIQTGGGVSNQGDPTGLGNAQRTMEGASL